MATKTLIVLFAAIAISFAKNYHGYRVLRVIPESAEGLEHLRRWIASSQISVLKEVHHKEYHVLVSPDVYDAFIAEFESLNSAVYLAIRDVQALIDKQKIENNLAKQKAARSGKTFDNTFYRTLDEIYQTLDSFAAEFPAIMSTRNIGTTYEGVDIKLMTISSSQAAKRDIVWIDCGIHAREWITPPTCLYVIDSLSAYGTDDEITALLDTYDFYILTVVNPDGYKYTWDGDRMWRKNRFPNENTCYGTDLNRNFDSDFGGPGTSDKPCSDIYHGSSAFSEKETQAIRDELLAADGRVKSYYNIHSFSQLWMTPYGYTTSLPANYNEMLRVSEIGVSALEAVYGTKYTAGNIAGTIYEAAGGSVDWTYDSAGIVYSFALELRDTGEYGFTLPANQIEPTTIETWEGIKAAVKAMK